MLSYIADKDMASVIIHYSLGYDQCYCSLQSRICPLLLSIAVKDMSIVIMHCS